MKTTVILFFAITIFSLTGCHKEVVTLSKYETTILSTAISKDIPQLQSKNESELLKRTGLNQYHLLNKKRIVQIWIVLHLLNLMKKEKYFAEQQQKILQRVVYHI